MTFGDKTALRYVITVRFIRTTIVDFLSKLIFKKQKKEYKKILINRDGAFGDSIVALPSLSVIRQNHPSAQIDLLSITNSQVSFIELNLDKHLINKLYVVKKNERKYILKTLKKENYDLFIQIPQNIGDIQISKKYVASTFLFKYKKCIWLGLWTSKIIHATTKEIF